MSVQNPNSSSKDEALGKALCSAARALARDLSVETVLDRLLTELQATVRCDRGAVLLADGDEVLVVRSFGDSEPAGRPRQPQRFSLSQQCSLAHAAAERRPLLVVDTPTAEISHQNTVDLLSHLTLPLLLDDTLLGFVTADSTEANAFSAQTIQALEVIASLAAAALHNAHLHESLRRERDRLMALASIDQQILATSDSPQIVMRTVLGYALRLLETPKGFSLLLSDGDVPALHAWGFDDAVSTRALALAQWDHTRRLFETQGEGWLLALNRAPSAPEQVKQWADGEYVQALLAVPLWLQGRLVGVVVLVDTRRRLWSEDDKHILKILASQATIAIDKAALAYRLRERLQASKEVVSQLQQLDKLKGQFIQNVSHELRTPLAIVKGYVDLIGDGVLGQNANPDFAAAIRAIRTHAENLTRIVESITTLGDVDVGQLHLMPQPLHPICTAALRANWQQALRRHITVVAEIPDDLPMVNLDAQGMLRALNHVLENALKFSPSVTSTGEGPTVWFRVFEREAHVWIQVEDQGIGIAPDEIGRVFERFYQIHGESTRQYGGLGIGLALVKEVTERHHGEVLVESPGEGLGTTISIKLPIYFAHADYGQGVEQS